MNRNLKFNLDIETNALLAANPDEFYSKAYCQALIFLTTSELYQV